MYELFITQEEIGPGTLSAATSCPKRSSVDYGNENEDVLYLSQPAVNSKRIVEAASTLAAGELKYRWQIQSLKASSEPRSYPR